MGMAQQTEVRITYETLYELMRLEKNREEMQKLPDNFIQDTLSYLAQLSQRRMFLKTLRLHQLNY